MRLCSVLLCLGILSASAAAQFYVAAPNTLRLDSDETIAVAIDGKSGTIAKVLIQDHPGKIKNLSETDIQLQPGQPKIFTVRLNSQDFPPAFLTGPTAQKLVVLTVQSQAFRKEVLIPVTFKAGYVFIQTDKPIYTPKQIANFRIIPLDENTLPSNQKFQLQIKNPKNIVVEETVFNRKAALQKKAFVSHNFKFPTYPVFGEWSATVHFGYDFQQNTTVRFELKEYVLPTFKVELRAQEVILPADEKITASITANYVYGKKVKGLVTFRLGVKGEAPKIAFFSVVGPKKIQGSYTLNVPTKNLKQKKDVGWFPEIEGSHFVIEATVVDDATGNKVEVVNTTGRFSKSPFVISFKRSLQDFKPGLVSFIEADVRYIDGQPAEGIQTRIKAEADGKPLPIREDRAVTDKEGKVSFELHPENHHSTVSATLETVDPRYEGSQAVGQHVQRKYQSKNKAYIALDRTSGKTLKPGDMFTRLVHFEPRAMPDVYYVVISRGKILNMEKLREGDFKAHRIDFRVTHEMVPNFRILVFAHFRDEMIADSLQISVENVCKPGSEVQIEPSFNNKEPGSSGKIIITGSKSTLVGLLGVDEAVYALSKKDLLTKNKVFKQLADHDLGCGPGGGMTIDSVLGNVGITLASNIYTPRADSISSCVVLKRRKREIAEGISSAYSGLEKQCCELGMRHDPYNRTCEERTELVDKYLQGEHENCSKAFATCCHYAEQNGLIRSRSGGSNIPDFIPVEEEAFFEKDLTVRSDFRETWIFEDISIGPDNREEYPVSLPHSITTWVVQAVSVSSTFGICVAEPQKIVSFKKIFVQLNLPYAVVRNEQVEIQATLFNYGDTRIAAVLYMYGEKDLCTGTQEGQKSERKRLLVEPQSAKSVSFPVIPLKVGTFDIKVAALSTDGSDVIVRKLNVIAEGKTEEVDIPIKLDPSNQQRRQRRHIITEDFSDSIDPSQNLQVTAIKLSIPERFVPGTESCSITALGDQFGPTVETTINNPEKLLHKPYGCGEQNMMFLAPTMYTMRYLKAAGKITPEIEEKGYSFIRLGYGNELAFRKDDGSFAAYQRKPTSTWLTAFVMKVFCQANELVHIDEKVMRSGVKWLVDHQEPDGSYKEHNPVYHLDMMGGVKGATPMTAFVLIALQECSIQDIQNLQVVKARAVSYLEQHLEEVKTPLPVAIVSYALALSDSELKEIANDKLLALAKHDEATNKMYWQTANAAQDVETAGYALLNQILFNDMVRSTSIVNWLNTKQLQSGLFKSTQDTVVALQALSEYAIRARMPSINLVANISSSNDRNFQHVLTFHEANALVLQEIKVDKIGGMLFINTAGHGVGSVAVKLRYNVFEAPEDVCKFIVTANVTESRREKDLPAKPVLKPIVNVFDPLNEDLIRGAENVLDAKPEDQDKPVLVGDPRHRVRRLPLIANLTRVKREDAVDNSKLQQEIKICVRYLGDQVVGMSIVDVGIFSGFEPDEEDLKKLQNDSKHLIDRYEMSKKGVVFYLRTVPSENKYCFSFHVIREFMVGNTQMSTVKVYDYYNPDETCTVFYSPGANSPLLHTICEGGVCQCAEGGCPPSESFPEVANEKEKKRDKLKLIFCENYNYVWKGKLAGPLKKEGGFYNITFQIDEVIKEGIEKAGIITGANRTLLARDSCNEAELFPDQTYLILGRDGQRYQKKNGEIWYRYLLDKTSVIYLWTEIRNAADKELQRALNYVTKKLKKDGCDF